MECGVCYESTVLERPCCAQALCASCEVKIIDRFGCPFCRFGHGDQTRARLGALLCRGNYEKLVAFCAEERKRLRPEAKHESSS